MTEDYRNMPGFADANSIAEDCRKITVCPLGNFYPNKNYGSVIGGYSDINTLLAAARCSAGKIDGVFIKNAKKENGNAILSVLINNEERTVSINLEQNI